MLEKMGCMVARTALLFSLGYRDLLRTDGSLPPEEDNEGVDNLLSILMSQPVGKSIAGSLILNDQSAETIITTIMGMQIEIATLESDSSSLVAQTVIGALEAFFATALDADLVPHTEKVVIELQYTDEIVTPDFMLATNSMKGTLRWPTEFSLPRFDNQRALQDLLVEVASKILASAFIIKRPKEFIEQLIVGEAVMNRATMVAVSPNSYRRVLDKHIGSIASWKREVHRTYTPGARPRLSRIDLPDNEEVEVSEETCARAEGRAPPKPPEVKDHRKMGVKSVIDVHSWDEAVWRGTAYVQFDPKVPPAMALMFENRDAASSIFRRWRERVGEADKEDVIRVSVIRNLPEQPVSHYTVMITTDPDRTELKERDSMVVASRMMTMQPDNDVNLERFLKSFHRAGAYVLMPAVLSKTGEPAFLTELHILKRVLVVRSAHEIGDHDIDRMALRSHLAPPRQPRD